MIAWIMIIPLNLRGIEYILKSAPTLIFQTETKAVYAALEGIDSRDDING
jgi:hypothetical protein